MTKLLSKSLYFVAGISLPLLLTACGSSVSDSREPIGVRSSTKMTNGGPRVLSLKSTKECSLDLVATLDETLLQQPRSLRFYTSGQYLYSSETNSSSSKLSSDVETKKVNSINKNLDNFANQNLIYTFGYSETDEDLKAQLSLMFGNDKTITGIEQTECETLTFEFGEDESVVFEIGEVTANAMLVHSKQDDVKHSIRFSFIANNNRLAIEESKTVSVGDFCSQEVEVLGSSRLMFLEWSYGSNELEIQDQLINSLAGLVEFKIDEKNVEENESAKRHKMVSLDEFQYIEDKLGALDETTCVE